MSKYLHLKHLWAYRFWRTSLMTLLAALSLCVTGAPTGAQQRVSAICDRTAEIASAETGVPVDVLRAISLTETGHKRHGAFLPWPWTVNMEGIGKWFEDYAEAQDYVDSHFARGARSFDVGCFQINYRWHGQAFSSIEEMFDPLTNARYAARFLRELHDEFGDWSRAAGAYHSRTPTLAHKYAARFDRIRSRLPNTTLPTVSEDTLMLVAATPEDPPVVAVRENKFPLLIPGSASAGLASLVPQTANGQRFLQLDAARPLGTTR